MNKQEKIKSLVDEMWEKTQELYKLRTSVNAVLVEFTEENRVFENGHVVLVCRRSDDSIIGQGIVTSARTFVGSNGRIDELELKRYAEQEGELVDGEVRARQVMLGHAPSCGLEQGLVGRALLLEST